MKSVILTIATSSLLLGSAICAHAQELEYHEPEIASLMFHVDRVPFDHDMLRDISESLVVLATRYGNQDTMNGNARLLAVAMRMTPKSLDVQRLNRRYVAGEIVTSPAPEMIKKAKAIVLYAIDQLDTVPDNQEARSLSFYLKDVMLSVDGEAEVLKDHSFRRYRWDHVVPETVKHLKRDSPQDDREKSSKLEETVADTPLSPDDEKSSGVIEIAPKIVEPSDVATDPKAEDPPQVSTPSEIPDPPNVVSTEPNGVDNPIENIDPLTGEVIEEPEIILDTWHKLSSVVSSPVYLHRKAGDKTEKVLTMSDFKVKLKPGSTVGGVNLVFKPEIDEAKLSEMSAMLDELLLSTNKWENIPAVDVTVTLPHEYSLTNGNLAVLPLYIQLYASLSDLTIPSNMRVLGTIDKSGNIGLGSAFWMQMKAALREQKPGLLMSPITGKNALKQLVALEEAQFFVRNETILVKNIAEVSAYLGDFENEKLEEAHSKFKKMRALPSSRRISSFSTDSTVVQTMKDIISLNSKHLSAQMILLRGNPDRSSKLSSYFLAEELKPLLYGMKWIYDSQVEHLNTLSLDNKAEEIDEMLDAISRYIDRKDSDITDSLDDIIGELESMAKGLSKKESEYHIRSANSAHLRFQKDYDIVVQAMKELQQKPKTTK